MSRQPAVGKRAGSIPPPRVPRDASELPDDAAGERRRDPLALGSLRRLAAGPELRPASLWVAACSAVFALAVGLCAWTAADFRYVGGSGVVGWLSLHHYPKQQEFVAYFGAFVAVALGSAAGWLAWLALGRVVARSDPAQAPAVLRRSALAYAGLLLPVIPFVVGAWSPLPLLVPAVAAFAAGQAVVWRIVKKRHSGILHVVARPPRAASEGRHSETHGR